MMKTIVSNNFKISEYSYMYLRKYVIAYSAGRPSSEDEHSSIQLKTTLYLDSIVLSVHTFIQAFTQEIANDPEP
jgi:hypothetical protein